MTKRYISRRQLLAGAGAAVAAVTTTAIGDKTAKAAAPPVPFKYCLNTSTIRGQKLPLDKEIELALLRRILPTEPETGDLVKWLKFQADQVNLDLRSFSRGKVTPHDFYYEHSYKMNMIAEYHDLGQFFQKVSGHDRLVNIKDLTINMNNGADRFVRSIRVQFNAVTYVYREETPQEAAP